jgi:hypothetical protein
MKKAIILALALALAGCAQQPMSETYDAPGFFTAIWHGLTVSFSLIGHIFDDSIRIYAFPNSGGWYDFGFLIGILGQFVFLGALAD